MDSTQRILSRRDARKTPVALTGAAAISDVPTVVGPMTQGCLLDIPPPDEYTMCVESVGGSCPFTDCIPIAIAAGANPWVAVSCTAAVGGLDINIEDQ